MKFYQTLQQIALPNRDIRPLGFIISALLTLVWFGKNQPINIDGITYLQLAQTYLNSGFMVTLHAYGWPFYPIMIALCSKLFGLSLFTAAKCLNVVFFGLITIAFVSIARTLKFSFIAQIIACLVIVFFPKLIAESGQFYRDFGFYAFMLFGFNAFLHFARNEKYHWYLAWIGCTVFASLFRIEGLVFLLTLPLISVFWQSTQKKWLLSKTLGTYLFIFVVLLIAYFLVVMQANNTQTHILIASDFIHIFTHIANSYRSYSEILKTNLLSVFGYDYIGAILISSVIGIIIVCLIKNMLPLYLFLTIYGWASKILVLNKNQQWIFAGYILTYLVILAGFAFQHLFLSGRYVLLLNLILFIPIAPAIEHFYKTYAKQLTPKHIAGYFSTFIVIVAVVSVFSSVIHIGVNNGYYMQSAEWINQNTPATATVYMNDPRLTYYVNRNGTQFPQDFPWGYNFTLPQMIDTINQGHFNYAMLMTRKAQIVSVINTAQKNNLTLVKSFINNRGDQMLIFQKQ